jgi:hypothetical protein
VRLEQVVACQALHVGRAHAAVAVEVTLEVVRRAHEVVVVVELVGLAAERPDALHPAEEVGFDAVLDPLDLAGRGARLGERPHLLVDHARELVEVVPGAGRGDDLELPVEAPAVLERRHLGRDLHLVNEPLVEPRRLAVGQDGAEDLEPGVVGREGLYGMPGVVEARQLHAVLESGVHVRGQVHRGRRGARHGGSARQVGEVPLDQGPHLAQRDVAGDDHRRVVRRVVGAVELPHVVDAGGVEVRHRADHRPMVRVVRRIQALEDVLLRQAVGLVLVALAALVLHHAPLQVHLGWRDLG